MSTQPRNALEIVRRRERLVERVREEHPGIDGVILLFAGLEREPFNFRQESSFFYLTGLTEPGLALAIALDGISTLYTPNYDGKRAQWMPTSDELSSDLLRKQGIDGLKEWGEPCATYQFYPFFTAAESVNLVADLRAVLKAGKKIFTLCPDSPSGYVDQRQLLARLEQFVPGLRAACVDIAPIVAQIRRIKSMDEVQAIIKAIEITQTAQEAAAGLIRADQAEYAVQAGIEYVFTDSGAMRPGFPSIVGSGPNSTVLHYTINERTMQAGDVVVVDIGAELDYYSADLTRTYPVSGQFSKRQREIYKLVLECQAYVADLAREGLWLINKKVPEESLHHLACAFFERHGYEKYFAHGLGHFLGLDVHDVGDYSIPLQEGDVITLEPGLYLPDEEIGVRIEDNYLIAKKGAVCLSEDLPKDPDAVERMVKQDVGSLAEHDDA